MTRVLCVLALVAACGSGESKTKPAPAPVEAPPPAPADAAPVANEAPPEPEPEQPPGPPPRDTAAARTALMEQHDAIRACGAKHGGKGGIGLQVAIGPDGKVTTVDVSGALAGTPTAACIEKHLRGMSFGDAGNTVTIRTELVL